MNLSSKLRARAEAGRPVRVGLIGAGKFGSMFLAQAPRTSGLHVMAIADLSPDRARQSLQRDGWTPETVWGHYGFSEAQVAAGDFNARMFNSFLDGTKSAIEMAAVANATGLAPAPDGLGFPACGVDDRSEEH